MDCSILKIVCALHLQKHEGWMSWSEMTWPK